MIQKDRYARSALRTISLAERHNLFKDLKSKKGTNISGGTYGNQSIKVKMARTSKSFNSTATNIKAACYNQTMPGGFGFGSQIQDPVVSRQPYQHDQKCPIIVRGHMNVDPNHLAIRNINGNMRNETLIPTWKCQRLKGNSLILNKY